VLSKTDTTGPRTYSWDFENRLASVVMPGTAGTVTFRYDSFGRRIQKVFSQSSTTTVTNYVYDGANSIEEVDASGNELARYAQGLGIDELLAELRPGTSAYYQQDGLGSVTSLSSTTGTLSNSYTYDTFGNLTVSNGSLGNPYQYTGRDYDSETGLRYYRARYYDPSNGRFLNEDPIGFRGGINFYSYAANNSVTYTDPFGNCIIYLFFEPPGLDKTGYFQHAFLITFDNSNSPPTRAREFRAGGNSSGNLESSFNAVLGGGFFAPTDDPKDAPYSATVLADNCSCRPYWQTLDALNAFISTHNIGYSNYLPAMNSNSVASTAIDAMGLTRPKLPFNGTRVPGWGNTLPGWQNPKGANGGQNCCK
jgi:RHS repeat-associated protein